MLKSTLLEILRTFSKPELIKFEDFVRSPYFNKKENVTKLFLEIKKYAPGFSNENLGKEIIWKEVFPGKEFNYGIMKNLIFDLNKFSVKFLELECHIRKNNESNVNFLQELRFRGLFHLFNKKIKESKDELIKSAADSEFFYYSYKFELNKIHLLSLKHNIKEVLNFDFNIYNSNLNRYFFTMFFETNSIFSQISFLYNKPLDRKKIDSVVKSYEASPYRNYYTDAQYYAFKIVFDTYSEDNYYKLKELFYLHFDKFSTRDKYMFAVALMNFCKNNSDAGNVFYIKERYQYNKIIADKELFFFDNFKYVDRYLFIIIVNSACTAGEFEWCEQFIKKYESNLEEEIREQFVNFAYTHLNFKSKNFEKALSYLSKCRNSLGMDKKNIKTYECYLYYELGYHEELKLLTDTIRHFVKNDKTLSDDIKTQFIKFVNVLNRLSEYKYGLKTIAKNDNELAEIKKYISENQISSTKWLEEKISELERK